MPINKEDFLIKVEDNKYLEYLPDTKKILGDFEYDKVRLEVALQKIDVIFQDHIDRYLNVDNIKAFEDYIDDTKKTLDKAEKELEKTIKHIEKDISKNKVDAKTHKEIEQVYKQIIVVNEFKYSYLLHTNKLEQTK